jgi:hypothetical protein
MPRWLIALALALAVAAPARAQNFAPQPPPPPPNPAVAGPAANICSTQWGWCPIRQVATPGGYGTCVVPPSTTLPGVARYYPYRGPVSPYLNPHVQPPATLR